MKIYKQNFYNLVYKNEYTKFHPISLIPTLYLKLKRYEIHRENAVFNILPRCNKYLDIGCGDGSLVFRMLGKAEKVYGIDLASRRIKRAENLARKEHSDRIKDIHFFHEDADEKLPFRNEYFESISMVATLEHFFDPFKIMEEITRIIIPAGNLVVQVPNICFFPRRIAFLFGKLPATSEDTSGWDGGHLHYFTINSLVNLMKKYNFTVEKITCSGIFAGIRSYYVSTLGSDIIISARKNSNEKK